QARLTILYCSTDRRCRRGAAVKNLSHSASFHPKDKIAPSNAGTKHLGDERQKLNPIAASELPVAAHAATLSQRRL
ncbi:MAG: hypothetical protein IJ935_16230, partial [Afipia sp.]|nr:hypothetical protein [Afipia sp.]